MPKCRERSYSLTHLSPFIDMELRNPVQAVSWISNYNRLDWSVIFSDTLPLLPHVNTQSVLVRNSGIVFLPFSSETNDFFSLHPLFFHRISLFPPPPPPLFVDHGNAPLLFNTRRLCSHINHVVQKRWTLRPSASHAFQCQVQYSLT